MQKYEGWEYNGDINLEEGGLFYRLEDDPKDWPEAVQVMPHPANPGRDHDDESWIVFPGVIPMPEDRLVEALACSGYEIDGDGIRTPTGETHLGEAARRLTIEACHGYMGIEEGEWSGGEVTRAELNALGTNLEGLVARDCLRGPPTAELDTLAP